LFVGIITSAMKSRTSAEARWTAGWARAKMIDRTYGHFVRDADDQDRDLLDAYDARRARSGHGGDEPRSQA
jgi:hypothetical protein